MTLHAQMSEHEEQVNSIGWDFMCIKMTESHHILRHYIFPPMNYDIAIYVEIYGDSLSFLCT